MEYLVTQKEMQRYDVNTIEQLKIPAIVLMERAALAVVKRIREELGVIPRHSLVVAGCGNNGGDGLAIGRILARELAGGVGGRVDFVLLGDRKKCTAQTALQLAILDGYGYELYDTIPEGEYDIIIDAVFGIGLTRRIEGIYRDAIETINRKKNYVCAVDIPSGIHADTGQIMGCAVKADLTVAFGFWKLGECLYPGAEYCGKLVSGQMGIDEGSFAGMPPRWYTDTSLADIRLFWHKPDGNKGTFGKVLVIAGSDTICGAALMSAESAFRAGAGMVKIVTSRENRGSLQQKLPETMLTEYDTGKWRPDGPDTAFGEAFRRDLDWADCILIGPGIGTGTAAKWMLDVCLRESSLPLVIDADGLNLLAKGAGNASRAEEDLYGLWSDRTVVLTPHMGEFARLYGCSVLEAAGHITEYPKRLADRLHCSIVCKDARTVVAHAGNERLYLNTSGNAGMATAGSGDVLAGILAGFLAGSLKAAEGEPAAVQRKKVQDAIEAGVYLHGAAGDRAAAKYGKRSMMASEIIGQMRELLTEWEWHEK